MPDRFPFEPGGSSGGGGGGGGTVDLWAGIPRVLHIAADQDETADGMTPSVLADWSSLKQHLTITGSITLDADGGPDGTPCYLFPTGAYATRLSPTLPQGSGTPGFSVLAVVKLANLSDYPEILEMGLLDRSFDSSHHGYQNAIASTGALYAANTGGDSERFSTTAVVTVDTWCVVGWLWTNGAAMSSTNPSYLVDGSAIAAASGMGTATANLTREALRVGGSLFGVPGQFLQGSLAELVLIPTDNSSVFTAASAILEEKYGL